MHYFKLNIGDYAKKAGRLSMLQHGSYTLLMQSCYDREQFPTLDEAIEWTWASTTDEIEAVTFVLRKFFTLENGVYVQQRIREEIAEYQNKANTNKRIAIKRETVRAENRTERARDVNESPTNQHESPPNHKPITINQEPVTKNQEPKTMNQEPKALVPSEPKAKATSKTKSKTFDGGQAPSPTAEIWDSYSNAYFARYSVEPVRNATVNGMLANFLKRLGAQESPGVAAWYVASNKAWYVQKSHAVSDMVRDAEGLRTEWATQTSRTQTNARMTDQTASNGEVFKGLLMKYHGVTA